MRIARSVGEASLLAAFVSALCTMPAPAAFAHGAGQGTGGWSVAGLTVVSLGIVLLLYSGGIARLWRRAGAGRGVAWWQLACFATGWSALAAALMSPLHELGDRLFAAHMLEHELLMVILAPALVLSRPLGAMLWTFPPVIRRRLARAARWPVVRITWRGLTEPASATILHGLAIWAHAGSLRCCTRKRAGALAAAFPAFWQARWSSGGLCSMAGRAGEATARRCSICSSPEDESSVREKLDRSFGI
ncbi:cytochrome c oxidase assembly protein [Mesorhizobium argentiipisi]|uniref:Cytochrome c oxidase assembly protein n=1 Tax=Mesorhizobium argentiipisi TaxID=3015175 RepID=A0ABU8KI34_9HYPH